jgi:hypothetical protein
VNALFQEVLHPLTLAMAGGVVLFGLAMLLLMYLQRGQAEKELAQLDLAHVEAGGHGPGGALRRRRVTTKRGDKGQTMWLFHDSPANILGEWVDTHVLHRSAFEAGPWLTGAALLCTFFLIALVLAESVGPAIRQGGAGIGSLSQAVSTMGAKFVVSMAGILMSIVHGFFRGKHARALYAAADEAAQRIEPLSYSSEAYQIDCAERAAGQAARIAQAIEDGQADQQANLVQVLSAIGKLNSIEVSIKDIGSELATSLQTTVKNDVVAGIGQELRDMADDLKDSLSRAFSASLDQQMGAVVGELTKIERAVASQAKDQVGELLQKLGDAVSGGFTSESARMKDALTRFAEVVPRLEEQLRTVLKTAGDDLARRSQDSSRSQEALMGRFQQVLTGIEAQQRDSAVMAKQMQELAGRTQNMLVEGLSAAGQQMAQRSQRSVEEFTGAMREATGGAAEAYRKLVAEAEAAASALQKARAEHAEGAQRLGDSARVLRDVLTQADASAQSLRAVAEQVRGALTEARATVETSAGAVKASRDAAAEQQKLLTELTQRFPDLAKQYLDATDLAFGRIASTWKGKVQELESTVTRVGDGVSSNVGAFAEAVEELGQHLSRVPGVKAPARS